MENQTTGALTEQDIRDHIVRILVEKFDVDAEKIRPNANLFDELGIDSIDVVDLIVLLNDTVGFRLPSEKYSDIRTIDDVAVLLKDSLTNCI